MVITHVIQLSCILLCKTNRQYLLTCKVSRYCLLALHGSIVIYIKVCNPCAYVRQQRRLNLGYVYQPVNITSIHRHNALYYLRCNAVSTCKILGQHCSKAKWMIYCGTHSVVLLLANNTIIIYCYACFLQLFFTFYQSKSLVLFT